jgi:hypothetical protein
MTSDDLRQAIGVAVAATAGMGAGEYLSDTSRSRRRPWSWPVRSRPAIPFATGYGRSQVIACVVLTIGGALLIGRFRGYRITLGALGAVASLTVVLSVLVA